MGGEEVERRKERRERKVERKQRREKERVYVACYVVINAKKKSKQGNGVEKHQAVLGKGSLCGIIRVGSIDSVTSDLRPEDVKERGMRISGGKEF